MCRVVEALAVMDRPASVAAIAAIAGADVDVVADALDVLGARPSLDEPGCFVVDDLDAAAEREAIAAARLATLVSRDARLRFDVGAPDEEVAELLLQGTGDERWAIPVLRDAADRAFRRGDPAHALVLLERALAVPGPPAQSQSTASEVEGIGLLIAVGRATAAAGQTDAAEHFAAAATRLEAAPEDLPASVHAELADACYEAGLISEARACYERALVVHRRHPDPTSGAIDEARIISGLSTTSLLTGRRHAHVVERLDALTSSPPDTPTLADRALMAAAAGEIGLGVLRPAASVERLVEAVIGGLALPEVLHRPMMEPVAAALSIVGRPQQAVELLDRLLAEAEEDQDVVAHISLLPLRGYASLVSGALAAAATDAVETLRLAARFPSASPLAAAPARYVAAVAALEADDAEMAASIVHVPDHAERWAGSPMHGWFLDALARVQADAGDLDGAVRTWGQAGAAFTTIGGSGLPGEWRDGLARTLKRLDQCDQARQVSDEQLAVAVELGAARQRGLALATAAAVTDEHERAIDLLAEAVTFLQASEARLDTGRVELELGRRLRRQGRRRSAREHLRRAEEVAVACGAHRLERLSGVELTLAGASSTQPGRSVLTTSEAMVAAAAASGQSNPEIAASLHMSRKTVEAHLSSVYRKLRIPNRSELREAIAALG